MADYFEQARSVLQEFRNNPPRITLAVAVSFDDWLTRSGLATIRENHRRLAAEFTAGNCSESEFYDRREALVAAAEGTAERRDDFLENLLRSHHRQFVPPENAIVTHGGGYRLTNSAEWDFYVGLVSTNIKAGNLGPTEPDRNLALFRTAAAMAGREIRELSSKAIDLRFGGLRHDARHRWYATLLASVPGVSHQRFDEQGCKLYICDDAIEATWRLLNPRSGNAIPPNGDPPSIVLGKRNERPIVRGVRKNQLTPVQFTVLSVLVGANGSRLSMCELELLCGDARGVLRRLANSDEDWRAAISFPRKKCKGYGLN